jgi:hypothetical protein
VTSPLVEVRAQRASKPRHRSQGPAGIRARQGWAPAALEHHRHLAGEDVADQAAAQTGDGREHQHPDDVEALTDRDETAGDREDGDPEQVEDEQQQHEAYWPIGISAMVS